MRRFHNLPPHRQRAGTLTVLVVLATVAGGSARALAASDLSKEMAELASNIKKVLDEQGSDSIAVGDFRGPHSAASAGPSIAKALTEQLEKIPVKVSRSAKLEVNGDYRDVEDAKDKSMAIAIKAQVVDSTGTTIIQFQPRGIFNFTTISSLLGTTVSLPAAADAKTREAAFVAAVDKPQVQLEKEGPRSKASTLISAASDSPYAMEVQVKSGDNYLPRAASKDGDGLAFLKIRRDELYAIHLINRSDYDAAVTLTIDGLSMFAFSENTNYTVVIVPAHGENFIPGWHRSNKVSDSFQVTEYSKSAVAKRLPSSSAVGTITACFAAAWPQDKEPPPDEPKAGDGARAGDATGQGPPVDKAYREVLRNVGRLRASISVRYTKDADPADLPPPANP